MDKAHALSSLNLPCEGQGENKLELLMQDTKIQQIASSANCSMILKSSGELFILSHNKFGQLDLGHKNKCNEPPLLMCDKEICQIECGGYHFMILKSNGDLLVFGSNDYGQLGLDDSIKSKKNYHESQLLMSDMKICQIACGRTHSMILKNNGDVFVFGSNKYGELGLPIYYKTCTPQLLMNDPEICQIACGGSHSMILKNNDELFVFGSNNCGQLGLGHTREQKKPIISPMIHSQHNSGQNEKIRQIVCGEDYTMILKEPGGKLYVFGNNDSYQLGLSRKCKKCSPYFLMSNVTLLPNINKIEIWTPSKHKFYPEKFRNRILTFMLIVQVKALHKYMPKFIRFEIIKKCVN